MDLTAKISAIGIVPVIKLKDANNAVPLCRALMRGGLPCAEITFRTDAAEESIRRVTKELPEVLVGAGTVLTTEQADRAMAAGAKFIVTPGFNPEVVGHCVEKGYPVFPGCPTTSDVEQAIKFGLKVVKFFPANVYGGLSAIKALSGPFVGLKFIPTGGVNQQNLGEFVSNPSIHAVGGSWVCPKADIAAHNFDKITQLCAEARRGVMGFELAHVGINCENADESLAVCEELEKAFDFEVKTGNSSNFASTGVEVMKSMYLGKNGHLAVRTNKIETAIAELEKRGFAVDMDTAKYKGDRMVAVYLKNEIGGFAVHLLQK